jgi:tight adherence protein C
MTAFVFVLAGLVFVTGALVALFYALGIVGLSSKVVRERLSGTAKISDDAEKNRVVRVQSEYTGLIDKLASGTALTKIERNVMLAGRPDGWSVRRIVIAKIVLSGIGVLLLLTMISGNPSAVPFLIGIVATGVGYFAPDILIQKRAEARQTAIQQELPDVLDQVTISIESGLGFEAAFARIGERRSGPLAGEIVRTVQDMRLGMSRRDAYQSMADRTDVDDLRRFVKSVIQAEQFGVSIASVVRTQASEIRFKRRKRAEATALKVPVKIIFPLMACILPVLFIVILTPAAISIVTML